VPERRDELSPTGPAQPRLRGVPACPRAGRRWPCSAPSRCGGPRPVRG